MNREIILIILCFFLMILSWGYFTSKFLNAVSEIDSNGGLKTTVNRIWEGKPNEH